MIEYRPEPGHTGAGVPELERAALLAGAQPYDARLGGVDGVTAFEMEALLAELDW